MDMGPRGLQLLAVLLALGLCAPAGAQKPSACQCSRIEASHRKNCGFPGISAAECFNTGCCFDSRVPNVPWCFHPLPKQESEQCVMEVAARKNCGYPGISPQECASRNCCFSDTIRDVPWCFFPILNQAAGAAQATVTQPLVCTATKCHALCQVPKAGLGLRALCSLRREPPGLLLPGLLATVRP
ncbi:trefoil factor 2 [Lycaon pictus]